MQLMAFLFHRKSGWVLVDHKLKVWKKLGRITKREANKTLKDFTKDSTYLSLGIPLPAIKLTFRKLCDDYLADIAGIKGDYTVDRESRLLDHFCKSFGSKQIDQVTPRAVEIHISEKGYKPYSAHNVGKALRAVYKFAVSKNYLPRNPMIEIRLPKIKKLPPKFVDPKLIQKVLNIIPVVSRAYFFILSFTGARPGEVLSLRAQDVTQEGIIFHARKTDNFRVVPVHPRLKLPLKRLLKGKGGKDFLFPGKEGHQKSFKMALRRACIKGKIKGVSLYSFRHTFATEVLKNTGDLRAVQTLLGHSRSTMTERYAHALAGTLKKAVGTL